MIRVVPAHHGVRTLTLAQNNDMPTTCRHLGIRSAHHHVFLFSSFVSLVLHFVLSITCSRIEFIDDSALYIHKEHTQLLQPCQPGEGIRYSVVPSSVLAGPISA
jgi:hypothetical protein